MFSSFVGRALDPPPTTTVTGSAGLMPMGAAGGSVTTGTAASTTSTSAVMAAAMAQAGSMTQAMTGGAEQSSTAKRAANVRKQSCFLVAEHKQKLMQQTSLANRVAVLKIIFNLLAFIQKQAPVSTILDVFEN